MIAAEGDVLMAEDWRLYFATTIAEPVPAAFPGGPSHPAGSRAEIVSVVTPARGPQIGFPAPSAVALALNIAARSALDAAGLQAKFRFKELIGPEGPLVGLEADLTGQLFDYFEHCFAATVFSIQALEAYCNYKIGSTLKGTVEIKRNKKVEALSARQAERGLSTDDKLGDVLPKLLQMRSPKGGTEWTAYANLRKLRDAIVHLKSQHQVTGADGDFDASPYAWFIQQPASGIPVPAIQLLRHFAADHERRWIEGAAQLLGV